MNKFENMINSLNNKLGFVPVFSITLIVIFWNKPKYFFKTNFKS